MRLNTFDLNEVAESEKVTKREYWYYITEQDFLDAEPL